MSIEINTRTYEFNHRKQPRGRGMWIFDIGGELFTSSPNQSYSEAASDARKVAAARGVRTITLMP